MNTYELLKKTAFWSQTNSGLGQTLDIVQFVSKRRGTVLICRIHSILLALQEGMEKHAILI